jgi:hypothetical protein
MRRRSSYDMHLRRNSGYAMTLDNDAIVVDDTDIIQDDFRELGVELDPMFIERMQMMGIDRTFSIANQAAELIKARRRESMIAQKINQMKYVPATSNPHYNSNSNNNNNAGSDGKPIKELLFNDRRVSFNQSQPRSRSNSMSRPLAISRSMDQDYTNVNSSSTINEPNRRSFIGSVPQPLVYIPSMPAGPELSLDPNIPIQMNSQRALKIIQSLHTLENDLYPPTRIEIEKLLQHLRIQYSRAPTRFVHRLLGLPSAPKAMKQTSLKYSKKQASFGENIPTYFSTDEQIKEIKFIINNRRFVTYDVFSAMIHNVRPDQAPSAIKELFNLLAEKREFTEPKSSQSTTAKQRRQSYLNPSKSPGPAKKRIVVLLDVWSFLTLLKTSKEESRCVYNMKSSKQELILDHLRKQDDRMHTRKKGIAEYSYREHGMDTNMDDDSLDEPPPVMTKKSALVQTSSSSRHMTGAKMVAKEIQTTENVSDSLVPSIIDVGNIRSASVADPTKLHRRKYSLFPYDSSAKDKALIDHYDSSIDRSNRRRSYHPSSDELAHASVAASLSMAEDAAARLNPHQRRSPHRRRIVLNEWDAKLRDRHPKAIDGIGAAVALGRPEDMSRPASANTRDFRYRQQIRRELAVYTPMEQILAHA